MFVDEIDVQQVGDDTRVSALVGGEEVWFQLPTEHFRGSVADALACFAFFPAMAQSPDAPQVQLNMPTGYSASAQMLENFGAQQMTFGAWANFLKPFEIDIPSTDRFQNDERIVSSFSGGVDSLFTAHTRSDEITHLVHIQGYELTLEKDPQAQGIPRIKALADRLGKDLIIVKTNALSVYRTFRLQRFLVFGCFMSTIAHLIGAARFYIPSSAPVQKLVNEGSHPYTDPRWSSEPVEIVYDINEFDRIEKMRQVDGFGYLDSVIVCAHNFESNCCRCIKCVRTMIGIELQGLNSKSFQEALTPQLIRNIGPLTATVGSELFGRYIVLARELGRKDLVRAMARAESRHRIKGILRETAVLIDDVLFGGKFMGPRTATTGQLRWHPKQWFQVIQ